MAKAIKPKPAKAASGGTSKKASASSNRQVGKLKQKSGKAKPKLPNSRGQGGKAPAAKPGPAAPAGPAGKIAKLATNGAKGAPPRPTRKPVKFDRKTLTAIKTSLLKMRGELEKELKELEEASLNVTQSEMSGEVGYDEDPADAGSFTFEREKDLSIANNVQDLLDKISRALGKIEEGTYGTCESCGQPIESARLKALPHALLCVRCKTAEERR